MQGRGIWIRGLVVLLVALVIAALVVHQITLRARFKQAVVRAERAEDNARESVGRELDLRESTERWVDELNEHISGLRVGLGELRREARDTSGTIADLKAAAEATEDLTVKLQIKDQIIFELELAVENRDERLRIVGEPDDEGYYPPGSITFSLAEKYSAEHELRLEAEGTIRDLLVAMDAKNEAISAAEKALGMGGGFWGTVKDYSGYVGLTYMAVDIIKGMVKK